MRRTTGWFDRHRRWGKLTAIGVVAMAVSSCELAEGALNPKGPVAADHFDNFMISVVVGGAVALLTVILMAVALLRRRSDDEDPRGDDQRVPLGAQRFVVYGGVVMPTVVLMGMMVVTFGFLGGVRQGGDIEILVTGHQYWWEVYYPQADTVTANEIHIPTGIEVEIVLMSDDVIHSFWVPELAGKQDLVPGRVNRMVIQADEPGVYRGRCAEYCGLQHAHMQFLVIAEEPAAYDEWIANEALDAAVDDVDAERIFEEHACAGCHRIRGTDADGQLGPDLTHFGSRRTIGAATVPNTEGHLGGWISNAQTIKPGAEMPPIPTLNSEELLRLIHYLRSLE